MTPAKFPGLVRLKLAIAAHGRAVAAVLLVVGVLALVGAGYAYAAPGTEETVEDRHVQTVVVETDVTATVVENASLWEPGTELRNRSAYITSESPEATVTSRVRVDGGELRAADPVLALEYRAERGDEVIWSQRDPLSTTVEEDERGVVAAATVNVTDASERVETIESEVGRSASASIDLVLVLEYETDRYEGAVESRSPLVIDDNAYELQPERTDERRATAVDVRQPREPDPMRVLVGIVGGIIALSAGAGVISFLRRNPDPDALRRDLVHARYAGWISRGELPVRSSGDLVEMASLSDLAEYAVDTDGRVVYDRDRGLFGVVDGPIVYYCIDESEAPPETPRPAPSSQTADVVRDESSEITWGEEVVASEE